MTASKFATCWMHSRLLEAMRFTYEAEAEEWTSETIIQRIFDELPVP